MNLTGLEQLHQRKRDDKTDSRPFQASQNDIKHPVPTVAQANAALNSRTRSESRAHTRLGSQSVSRATAKSTNGEATTNAPAPGGGHGLVWVNTDSHVHDREGSRFYRTSEKSKYMTEAER